MKMPPIPDDDDMTAVPTMLIEALRDYDTYFPGPDAVDFPSTVAAIIACLPKPAPEFSYEVSVAFYNSAHPTSTYNESTRMQKGHAALINLYESGWLTVTDDGSFIITPPRERT